VPQNTIESTAMKKVTLPCGEQVPALGQGTWYMGTHDRERNREADALRLGLDLGMTLIDTAEMYDDAELVVAQALKGRRDEAFVVSKVLPSNASYKSTISACERSLKRLQIECLDLYLLHWASSASIEETLSAFEHLVEQGKIRHHGISNLDEFEMQEALSAPGGDAIQTNQVLYNLNTRGVEWDLLALCRRHSIPLMAYSPLDQARLDTTILDPIARRHNVSACQIALAWVLNQPEVIAIPKAVDLIHVKQNAAVLDIQLTDDDLTELDTLFPAPTGPSALQML
jgi:diketogulonate reductase-like aldo/keto reductase